MIYLFVLACFIIALLVLIMFLILKKTVKVVNSQTKTYFVDKLQAYDSLISEKEQKLNEINELLKNKELGLNDKENNLTKSSYNFDYNIIDLFNSTEYQNSEILSINKKINEKFDFDHEKLIKDFLLHVKNVSKYEFCLNLKNKFTSEIIYQVKLLLDCEVDDFMKKLLDNKEYEIYLLFNDLNEKFVLEDFLSYLDRLVEVNNPNITIYVSNEKENYDHLSKYIKTIVSKDIYSGIKIVYKDRVYDFSLSERNV